MVSPPLNAASGTAVAHNQRTSSGEEHPWTNEAQSLGGEAGQQQRGGMGSIPWQPGEMEASKHDRPTSAPPPGFATAGPDERNRLAEELIWGSNYHHQQQHHPGESAAGGSSMSDMQTLRAALPGGERPASSNNDFSLAQVLGTGLAESVEDATSNNNDHASSFLKDDLNFHRQTRHVASRLVGTPPANNTSAHARQLAALAGAAPAPGGGYQVKPAPGSAPLALFDSSSYRGGDAAAAHAGNNFSRGFPSSLSTPQRNKNAEESAETPESMKPGQTRVGQRNNYPLSKDIGSVVEEPEGDMNQFGQVTGIVSQRLDNNNQYASAMMQQQPRKGKYDQFERDFEHLWSPNAMEFKPASSSEQQQQQHQHQQVKSPRSVDSDANSSISDSMGGATEISTRQAENELRYFLWDIDKNRPSRTLAILHVSWLRAPEVRSACEAYGVLESFRADFSSKGIFFASYYDIRSAQYASVELQPVLQRMLVLQRCSEEAVVRFCLALSSSSQYDESQISISDLPPEVNEGMLASALNSFGAIRSVMRQSYGSYLVEFQNIQDAKQALLELDSSQPWGPSVACDMGVRNPVERKRGRDLLAMIARWRSSIGGRQPGNPAMTAEPPMHSTTAQQAGPPDLWRTADVTSSFPMVGGPVDVSGYGAYGATQRQNGTPQLVLGPDGRYQIVMQQNPPQPYGHHGAVHGIQQQLQQQLQQQQQIVQGPNGQIYVTALPIQQSPNVYIPQQTSLRAVQGNFQGAVSSNPTYGDAGRRGVATSTPFYTHVVAASDGGSLSGRSYRSERSGATEDRDNRHLTLDLEAVEEGTDIRTSLMVRNIPNKYTQQMLLSEFAENSHGPGIIDFFYLPIDFKNRCNRGYAFINFVNYADILPFHRHYFGKHWRTFNSDKICDITYARIQGKAAMLKRFENSALMEKDDEYKPLVFVSDGPNKGQRLPFPGPAGNNPNERAAI